MPLVLSIIDQRLRYSLFLIFCHPHQQGNILEFRKWLYLSLWVKIKKTKGTLFSQTLKVEGNKVPFVFSIFDQGLRYGQSKNFEVFPFDVTYWIMSTLEAALPDWFGQKYLTRCLKYQNGMGLTWELINPRNFDFLCPSTVACLLLMASTSLLSLWTWLSKLWIQSNVRPGRRGWILGWGWRGW